MDHVTPFGARVEPPPVIIVERRRDALRLVPEFVCPLLWAVAILLMINFVCQSWQATADIDQQIAWEDRV